MFARFSENYLLAGGSASLSDYYTAKYDSAVFDRSLKQAILFSDHSLATDSIFAERRAPRLAVPQGLEHPIHTLAPAEIGAFLAGLGRRAAAIMEVR